MLYFEFILVEITSYIPLLTPKRVSRSAAQYTIQALRMPSSIFYLQDFQFELAKQLSVDNHRILSFKSSVRPKVVHMFRSAPIGNRIVHNIWFYRYSSIFGFSVHLQKPKPPEGHKPDENGLYSKAQSSQPTTKPHRYIPQQPDRVLDAPELLNDFYINILDWSNKNKVCALCSNTAHACFGQLHDH
jgi:hypothetical protein